MTAIAQPRYDLEKMSRERLNRGVVAVRSGERVVVSWRTLSSDASTSIETGRNSTPVP